jgi:putative membrane protein
MSTQTFRPHPKYRLKLRLVLVLVAIAVLLGSLLIAIPVGLERRGLQRAFLVMAIAFVLDAVWWVPAMLVAGPYYDSLSYEIQDDQVVMRVGIWTRAVKHVPYRTVTNVTVKQGLLDRLLGLGTLDIQTAGMSGQGGAEQSLVGLENAQEVYEIVVARLRRYRGGMAPTAAEMEGQGAGTQLADDALDEILAELRAIRRALEK